MIRPGKQTGYILLPVIVVITLVAAIALLMNTESALESNTAASELDAQQAQYVAEAGLNHALWLSQQQGCGAYTDLTDVVLANDKYSTKLTTDLGATTSFTLPADQDDGIVSAEPDENNGGSVKLNVSFDGVDEERALMRFDLSALPANASILSAKLRLWVDAAHPAGSIDIHQITTDWLESDATWNSMNDQFASQVIASIPPQPTSGVSTSSNLTSLVQLWVNGQPNYGILLKASSIGVSGKYTSSESANAPYLEVVVGSPPTSPATLKVDGELANGVERSIKRKDVTLRQQPASFSLSRVTTDSGQDAMLDSFYKNRDYGVHELEVSLGSGSTLEHSLLQFELPAIAPGARIISAQLELYHYVTTRNTGTPVVAVHRVTRSWVEGTHDGTGTADGATWETWDGSSNWTSFGGDHEVLAAATSEISPVTGDWENWEIGALVQGWIDGRFANHGLHLKGTGDFDISFASREDANPALHPKLEITYACTCGEVCVAPQGSGNLLMVVINPITLVAEDQKAKDLFESWGYTVSAISASANQSSFDSAFLDNDVVFISETVTSGTLGGKLDSAPIGVVSQDGDYNPDLGLAPGASLRVGGDIDIVDTDHYITRPFAIGTHRIYTADMEQAIVSGSLTADQLTLAEIGGDGSLVVLDQGDAMESGGTAAGRRIILPLGTRYRFDWDYLNANGRLLVQRALEWGAGNEGVVDPDTIILSTHDNAELGGLVFTPADLVEYDLATDTATLFFDGATLFTDPLEKVQSVQVLGNGHIILSTRDSATLGGLSFTQADLVEYDAGTDIATLFLNGVALFSDPATRIASAQVLANGLIILSTWSDATLGGLTFTSAQLVEYDPATNIASLYFDGTTLLTDPLGIIDAVHVIDNGHIVLSTWAANTLGGLSFGEGDLVEYDPVADTSTLYFDGAALFTDPLAKLVAVHIGPGSGAIGIIPLAHWKLDDGTGPTAIDSVGNHDGTLVSNPAWVTGIIDGGLDFDGVDDYVDAGSFDVSGSGITMMGWFNAEAITTDDGRIVSKADGPNDFNAWWQLSTTDSGSNRHLRMRVKAGGTTTTFADSSVNLVPGQWYFAVGTYDNASGAMKLYLDGAEVASGTHAVGGALDTDPAVPVAIGANGTAERFFDGILDDVRIYNRALSAAEIAELAGQTGPIAHWKLDETSGFNAEDSASDNDGTLIGGNDWIPAVIDGGLDFDGSNDYVDAGSFDVSGSGITLMGWFNAEAIATDDGRIVSKANGPNATDAWWQLGTTDSGSDRFLRMRIKAGGTTTTLADSSVNLSTGQWYLAVATYSNATGDMKLYLDGTEIASGTHAVGSAVDTDAAVPVAIGANGTAERFFNGILDDVRVYDYALPTSEIADLYAANPPPGAASYTELYQPWSATTSNTWQTVDLSVYGVPANAVVEVALENKQQSGEFWAGARAVGSSLERRFLLHEAEGGGVDTVTLHVQTDASGQIQHYSGSSGFVSFNLLGYWTGATYVERFDAFKAGANASWQPHDLGAYGVGPDQVAEIALSQTSTSIEWLVGARRPGSGLARRISLHEAEGGGIDMVTLMAGTDVSSIVEVYAEADSVVDFHLLGYWSTPPGTYTETGGVHGQATVSASWQTTDLSGFGIPANSIAQFVMSNERDARENQMGLRETGSTINNRRLDLQEAESGGGDLATMHVRVDASSQIQWAAEYGSTEGFFYPVGWWDLTP